MKTNKLVFLGLLTLFAAHFVLAGDQKKEVPIEEAIKCFCATWVNPAYYEDAIPYSGKIVVKDDTIEWYKNETSKSHWCDKYKIEKSWIDKDGNVWVNVLGEPSTHIKIQKKYILAKISGDGNTLEFAYDWTAYPTVDPESWPHYIMYKK